MFNAHHLQANSVVFEKVEAPRWLHRFIIGRKGQNVRKITQDLPKVHVEFSDEEEVVSLEGPPAEVAQAKEAFEMFTRDLVSCEPCYNKMWFQKVTSVLRCDFCVVSNIDGYHGLC